LIFASIYLGINILILNKKKVKQWRIENFLVF
jgi:hypothetical protein